MDNKKRELLSRFADELRNSEDIDGVSLFTMQETGAPVDTVRCIIREQGAELADALGEFMFLPVEGDEVFYFSTVITVSDNIGAYELSDLVMAVSKLNYVLPCGCFAVSDDEKTLVFRHSAPVYADQDEAVQLRDMLTAADAAMMISDRFEGYLLLVQVGDMSPEEMMDAVLGRADS